jgi:fumarate reductase subunit D
MRPRSNSPVFWALFGAGGMLAALLGPGLVVATGFWPDLLTHARVLAFAQSFLGKAFLFLVVSLFAWHAAHRILCSVHDVGIHKTLGVKSACYGVAMAITLVAAWALSGV